MSNNYITKQEEKGSVNISEDVIAVMVGAAIAEVEGVAGFSNTVGTEIIDFLGKKSITRGVSVSFDNDEITVDVILMMRFGCNITATAQKVQDAVCSAVVSMTGLPSVVNVHVAGIAFDKQ